MKSRPWAAGLAISVALLLTWAYSTGVGDGPKLSPSLRGLLVLSTAIFGFAGTTAAWICDWIRGHNVGIAGDWVDYVVYFLTNGLFFIAVLWRPRDDFEKKLFFFLRLPFFLLLTLFFWLGVLISVPRLIIREPSFRTPRRMWGDLIDWLHGSPVEHRVVDFF